MKTIIALCAAACVAAPAAAAATVATVPSSIIASFRSPWDKVYGLDYFEGELYHVDGDSRIAVTTPGGSVLRIIFFPPQIDAYDIENTRENIWLTGPSYGGLVVGLTRQPLGIYYQFRVPGVSHGIAVTGVHPSGPVWVEANNTIYRYNFLGVLLGSFNGVWNTPRGLDYDNGYLWLADSDGFIRRYTTTGSQVMVIGQPGHIPVGVSRYQGRPEVFYTDAANNYVYRIDYSTVSTEPASVGKIKALYR